MTDTTDILGNAVNIRIRDDAQLPMRLNEHSFARADSARGALTALQRELLEQHASEIFQERFFSSTERLPARLFLANDQRTGELVGCAGIEAAVVDRQRCLILRRSCTPLLKDLKPDGSLPDGMEVRSTLVCHAVASQWRRRGLGTALFHRVAQMADEWGMGPLLMMVDEEDTATRVFYESSLGCVPVFRDAEATAMRPDSPPPQYTRTVLDVRRVPMPQIALQYGTDGAGQ